MILLAVVLWKMASTGGQSAHEDEPSYTNFLAKVQSGNVKDVTIYLSPNSAELQGEYRDGSKFRGVTVANTAIPDVTKALAGQGRSLQLQGSEGRQLGQLALQLRPAHPAGRLLDFHDEADAGRREQSPQLRQIPRAFAYRAAEESHVQGRRRNRRSQGRAVRNYRLPERSAEIPEARRTHSQGRAARRPSGNRQDFAGPRDRRRSQRSVLLDFRFGLRRNVRRRRRQPRSRPFRTGQEECSLHHLHRRN